MDIKQVALIIVDISGYTEFIKTNRDTLAHAHEVISQLLESVADRATHPLVLNKFEGDAAFLYAEMDGDAARACADIAKQVFGLFPAFQARMQELSRDRAACPCAACRNIEALRLKAFVHRGEAAFRKIRQFEELAGADVILVHRLLKNSVAAREYVLMTEAFCRQLDPAVQAQGTDLWEEYDHLGRIAAKLFLQPASLPAAPAGGTSRVLPRLAARLGLVRER